MLRKYVALTCIAALPACAGSAGDETAYGELDDAPIIEDDAGVVDDDAEDTEVVLGSTSQAVQSAFFESSCDSDERAFLRQAVLLGRTVANSKAMAQCLAERISDPDRPYPRSECGGDPYSGSSWATIISKVQSVVKSTNALEIHCDGDGRNYTAGEDQHGYDFSGAEVMHLSSGGDLGALLPDFRGPKTLTDQVRSLASKAGLIWHEATHAHGYDHCGGNNGQGYVSDIPVIVQGCMNEVANASADLCSMNVSCGTGARLALIDSYPATSTTGCECVRDMIGSTASTAHAPASPYLDTNYSGDLFGSELAVGDFNGDGFDDAAVGARGDRSSKGQVYVFYGSVFGLYPAKVLTGDHIGTAEPGDEFGSALAAGDFNGDRIDDLAVGAPNRQGGGRVLLYRGTTGGLVAQRLLAQSALSAPAVVNDDSTGDLFGASLAAGKFLTTAGGTRIALAVGAPGETFSEGQSGMVAVFAGVPGSDDLVSEWGWFAEPGSQRETSDYFGSALAFGKLFKDGDALVVGDPGDRKVHVIDPQPLSDASRHVPTYAIAGPSEAIGFGASIVVGVSYAGSEGPSITVGAPSQTFWGNSYAGALHVFYDRRTTANPNATYSSGFMFGGLGNHMVGSALAKINGQLLVGAPGSDGGRVYRIDRVLSDGEPVTKTLETRSQAGLGANEVGDAFGSAIAVGDFNADGFVEYIIGAKGEVIGSDAKAGAFFEYQRDPASSNFVTMAGHNQSD